MTERNHVPVACAVIQRNGLVLIAQRPVHKHLAFKWEFPGGKLERGETPSIALHRELKEELGCEVEIIRPLPCVLHDYGHVLIAMSPFLCRLANSSPEPVAREHAGLQWILPFQLPSFDLAGADLPVVATWKALVPADFNPHAL